MKILLDTNIIIPLEDTSKDLDSQLAMMKRLASEGGHTLYVHDAISEDISHDQDKARKEMLIKRLKQYPTIPDSPQLTEEDRKRFGWREERINDKIDNLLLYAVCLGAVHFLITNDEGIHKKAKQAKIQEQVHRPNQFIDWLNSSIDKYVPPPYGVRETYLYKFDVKQTFFDSLRRAYDGFDQWYLNAAKNDSRKAWCICDSGTVQAICIFKTEEKPKITDDGNPLDGSTLKLCTFKVGDAVRGRKLGERLLLAAFKYAANHHLPYVYLHAIGEEQELLVSLCLEYGFKYAGQYDGRDSVYLKTMIPRLSDNIHDNLEYAIQYYPNYRDDQSISKYLVPIKPKYHDDLFPDTSEIADGLFGNDPNHYSPQANTIKKAYLCHSQIKTINPGDILLFYRSGDRKSVECIGIVEQTYHGRDYDKIFPLVSKRTVFSSEEIIREYTSKETLVILFRYIGKCSPVKRTVLQHTGIEGNVQSIREITHEQYKECFPKSTL